MPWLTVTLHHKGFSQSYMRQVADGKDNTSRMTFVGNAYSYAAAEIKRRDPTNPVDQGLITMSPGLAVEPDGWVGTGYVLI